LAKELAGQTFWPIFRPWRSSFSIHNVFPFPPLWEDVTIKNRSKMTSETRERRMTDENNTERRSRAMWSRRWALGCSGCVWPTVGVFLFLLVVIALLLPAVNTPREAMRRSRCVNNLKTIGFAMNSYHVKYGVYPPAYTVDKRGRRMHSWRALLLEFIDPDLYARYDFGSPWNSPRNLEVAAMMKKDGPYYCPSVIPRDSQNTSYVMLVGRTAFSAGPSGRKLEEITDEHSNTIAVGEMSPSGIPWTAPYDLDFSEMTFRINDRDQPGLRSCHSNGVNVLFADGHVAWLHPWHEDAEMCLKDLVTINGGEKIDESIFQ
jgi:prepilin-type processing-associated H-X9-DG protein